MARRSIAITAHVRVYRDDTWEEYQVEYRDGSAIDIDRTRYHTSDKVDALDTMHRMEREYDVYIANASTVDDSATEE